MVILPVILTTSSDERSRAVQNNYNAVEENGMNGRSSRLSAKGQMENLVDLKRRKVKLSAEISVRLYLLDEESPWISALFRSQI